MKFKFTGKRVSGLLTVVPANERSFLEDMKHFNFPEARSLKLKEVMGFDKRRVVQPGVCVSDLVVYGLQQMFERGWLAADEIDALILVTQTPDYLAPPTSNIVQARAGLRRDALCLDISQACAGFVVGLIEAFMLLEQESIRKVVLVNADVLSRKVSSKDRNIYPIIGDAASFAVVERGSGDESVHAVVMMDGSSAEALIIPAGGMRLPSSAETAVLEDAGDNNLRAKDHLKMDGAAVFNFVQTEVPPLIQQLLEWANVPLEAVDCFACHQPNRFMLQKLADKMGVPHDKMPNNVVERFGNSSGATIPVAVITNLSDRLTSGSCQMCLAGFGGGLTWATMSMRLGPLEFCQVIDYA